MIDLDQPRRQNPNTEIDESGKGELKSRLIFDGDLQMGAVCRVVGVQAVTVIFCASLLFFWLGINVAVAAFFGGAVAVANALFLVWCLRAGAQRPVQDARQELAWLVRFSMERFLVVALLIAAGLGWLKLLPVPLLIGFVLGQLTLVVTTIFSGIEKY